jgi:hypothetical protein
MPAPAEFGGMDMYNTWTYTNVEPHLRIEYVMRFSDKDGNQLDPAARTEMTFTEYGYTSAEAHDMSKAGLEQCLDKMQTLVEHH